MKLRLFEKSHNECRLVTGIKCTATPTYTFGANGNRLTALDANGSTTTYTIDSGDRLTKDETSGTNAHTYDYSYDSRDNILTNNESGTIVTFSYDASSRLTTSISGSTVTTYTFDANGNMTLAVVGSARTTLTYDEENRALTWRAGLSSNSSTWKYNGMGQKIYEQNGLSKNDPGLVWDGNDYLGQVGVGAEEDWVFVNWINSVGGIMYAQGTDFMVDYLGSVTGLTDGSGSVVNTFRYKPYGARLSGGSVGRGFYWTGNTGSRSTGRAYAEQYNRARHYSSTTNQWISRDPLWPQEPGFGYVRGNPVERTDATGELWEKAIVVGLKFCIKCYLGQTRSFLCRLCPKPGGPEFFPPDDLVFKHGNWCGKENTHPGCGPQPVDCADSCCREHDMLLRHFDYWSQLGQIAHCRLLTCVIACTRLSPPGGCYFAPSITECLIASAAIAAAFAVICPAAGAVPGLGVEEKMISSSSGQLC